MQDACPAIAGGPPVNLSSRLSATDCHADDIASEARPSFARRVRLTMGETRTVRIEMSSEDFDTFLYLVDENGRVIAGDDDGGTGLNSRIAVTLPGGEYWVVATSFSKAFGDFRLVVSAWDPASCGYNAISANATVVDTLRPSDCPLEAFLGDGASNVYSRAYRLVISERGMLTVDMRSAEFDTMVFLLNSRMQLLGYDDDGGVGTNSRLERQLTPGVYYLLASSYAHLATGSFELNLRLNTGGQIITLFLHGLNSSADAWEELDDNEYGRQCSEVSEADLGRVNNVPISPCYMYNFRSREVEGVSWGSGDGATYAQLGDEVGQVVEWIRSRHSLSGIVLVGHSRGGLAARAYLQSLPSRLPIRTGLVTVGTPHLGSPFGRLGWWLNGNGKKPSDEYCVQVPESAIRFAFSPSTKNLATAHNSSKSRVRNITSEAIWALNDAAYRLPLVVDSVGEIRSKRMWFGENVAGGWKGLFLDASTLINCMSYDANEAKQILDYVQLNLPDHWLTEGDGVVPYESQQLSSVSGATSELTIHARDIASKTSHVDETARTGDIKWAIDQVAEDLSVAGPLAEAPAVATAPTDDIGLREQDGDVSPRPCLPSREGKRKDLVARLRRLTASDPKWGASVNAAALSVEICDMERLMEIGSWLVSAAQTRTDPRDSLGIELLLHSASEKGALTALASVAADRGWDRQSATELGARMSRLPLSVLEECWSSALSATQDGDLKRWVAGFALARKGAPGGVRMLVRWASIQAGEPGVLAAVDILGEISTTKGTAELRKLLRSVPFRVDAIRTALATISERR
jgi:pimeloyl-ACP methyl ester carboxylesterase